MFSSTDTIQLPSSVHFWWIISTRSDVIHSTSTHLKYFPDLVSNQTHELNCFFFYKACHSRRKMLSLLSHAYVILHKMIWLLSILSKVHHKQSQTISSWRMSGNMIIYNKLSQFVSGLLTRLIVTSTVMGCSISNHSAICNLSLFFKVSVFR